MTDEEVEDLFRLCMEFTCRQDPLPDELKVKLDAIPEEQQQRVFNMMCDEAARN